MYFFKYLLFGVFWTIANGQLPDFPILQEPPKRPEPHLHASLPTFPKPPDVPPNKLPKQIEPSSFPSLPTDWPRPSTFPTFATLPPMTTKTPSTPDITAEASEEPETTKLSSFQPPIPTGTPPEPSSPTPPPVPSPETPPTPIIEIETIKPAEKEALEDEKKKSKKAWIIGGVIGAVVLGLLALGLLAFLAMRRREEPEERVYYEPNIEQAASAPVVDDREVVLGPSVMEPRSESPPPRRHPHHHHRHHHPHKHRHHQGHHHGHHGHHRHGHGHRRHHDNSPPAPRVRMVTVPAPSDDFSTHFKVSQQGKERPSTIYLPPQKNGHSAQMMKTTPFR